jgi:hypothetical protein
MVDSNLEKYVTQLYKAMKGAGTDEDTLIKVSVDNPLKTRLKIKSQYKLTYGSDLLDDFKSDLSGNFLELMLGLYTDIYEYDADQCHKAIEGLGTNEDTLIEIIGTRPGWMIKKVKEIYKNKYKVELEDDVKGDTSGNFRKLLISLLQCSRSENKNPDKEKCTKIAEDLYNAGEKKLGTDEQTFNKYFGTTSPSELMIIAREYHRLYGNSLMKAIESEFSGDIKKLIKTVFYANISPSEYFATRIREAVKGLGTNEKILNRVIVTRNEIDIKLIKQYYKLLYQRDMVEDIKSDTSGDYRKLLVALIEK